MVDAIFPESRCRKFLSQHDRATLNETVADAEHSAGRVVERQGVVNDVITAQFEKVIHGVRHVEKPAEKTYSMQYNPVERKSNFTTTIASVKITTGRQLAGQKIYKEQQKHCKYTNNKAIQNGM